MNIPIAIGPAIGAKVVGALYGSREKATLALRYLAEKTDFGRSRGSWDGDVEHLASFLGVPRSDAVKKLVEVLGTDASSVNQLLWDTYHPYDIWYPFAVAGVVSLTGMLVFSRLSKRWKHLDV